eukprot:SAG11_NODE_13960_length_631_cov_1.172932_2_plen_51_part_00
MEGAVVRTTVVQSTIEPPPAPLEELESLDALLHDVVAGDYIVWCAGRRAR